MILGLVVAILGLVVAILGLVVAILGLRDLMPVPASGQNAPVAAARQAASAPGSFVGSTPSRVPSGRPRPSGMSSPWMPTGQPGQKSGTARCSVGGQTRLRQTPRPRGLRQRDPVSKGTSGARSDTRAGPCVAEHLRTLSTFFTVSTTSASPALTSRSPGSARQAPASERPQVQQPQDFRIHTLVPVVRTPAGRPAGRSVGPRLMAHSPPVRAAAGGPADVTPMSHPV